MTVRKSLPYQGIARRALSIKHASGNYNKDIDISAFLPKRRFNVIDREKEKEMSKTKRHMYDPLYDPLGSDSFVGTEEFPSWVPKDLSPLVTPEEAAIIDKFYEAAMQAGATGGKISGAGGGGFMFFYCPGNSRYNVINTLEQFGGHARRYEFTRVGLETWTI